MLNNDDGDNIVSHTTIVLISYCKTTNGDNDKNDSDYQQYQYFHYFDYYYDYC